LVGWIRIRNQDGKNYQQNEEIFKFEVLDVTFCGMKTFLVAWMSIIEP
jgi:hypothetical protein